MEWLVTTFRALPGINSQEFRDLVYFSYTPEEAQLVVQMGPDGGSLDELVAKTGMKKEDLKALIESMREKGTMYTEPGSKNPTYRPLGMELPGLIESQAYRDPTTPFMKKLFELWGKFKPIYVGEGISPLGKSNTAWCQIGALPPDAKPEENVIEQLKAVKDLYIAVTMCPCRQIEHHGTTHDACDCIMECCMPQGEFGRWAVEQGYARHITLDEAVKVIKICEEKGQLLMGTPGLVLCNCCKHGCIQLYAQQLGKPHVFAQNHFYALVDSATCTSCEACVERCSVNAIKMDDAVAVVDQMKCIGCGACVTGCSVSAIRIVRRSAEEIARLDGELRESVDKMLSMTKLDPLVLKVLSGAV
jgi:Na+-translocating ferredoxin:NAD+ oxidoreductase subunit B